MAEKKKKPFKGYNKKKHSRTGGLNDKERARINREEGSNLKRPVTGKVKAGSKAANRRKSFCARMSGVKGPTSKDGQLTPKGAALKRWKCRKSLQKSDIPPKAKLAAFLRDHIDNKLALKAAEPTITKSGELEKAISPEQQKENIKKQRELQNRLVVEGMKGFVFEDIPKATFNVKKEYGIDSKPVEKEYGIDSKPVDLYDDFYESDKYTGEYVDPHSHEYEDFLEENKHLLPHHVYFEKNGKNAGSVIFEPHENGKNIRIVQSNIKEEHKNKGLEEAAQKIAEEHYGKPLLTSKKTQPKSVPSKPEPTPAPASSKASHLRVVKSLNADKTGMSALMKALKECACKKSDKLSGGKGDTKDILDFDPKEVEMGLKVEMEHTKDRKVAQEIVADHLSEDPSYYSKLKGSGLADELEKAISPEQQKENIRKQRELQNKKIVEEMKGKTSLAALKNKIAEQNLKHTKEDVDQAVWENPMEAAEKFGYSKFLTSNHIDDIVQQAPHEAARFIDYNKLNQSHIDTIVENDPEGATYYLQNHPLFNAKHIDTIIENDPEGAAHYLQSHPLFNAKHIKNIRKKIPNWNPSSKSVPSKPEPTLAPTSSKASHLRVVKSLEKAGRCWEGYEPTPGKKPYSKGSCRKIKKSITAEAIEAGQYQGEQLDSHHHNRLGVEYKGMAQKAHKMGDKKKARDFHDKALHHFKMADKMGFQREEPLEKKISGKVAAAGLGLASALAGLAGVSGKTSETADKPPQVQMTAKPIPKEKYPDFNAHDAISMIESSGGKNIIHKFIPKQNQRAVSRYGLLPTRVMELYARSPEFRESPQGKMVGEILEPHLSKHKTKNFYDTAAFVQKTPKDVRGQLYQQINKITENPEHDKAIFEASRKHSMENLSSVTSDPVELEIMATHAHHWHWPRTKRLYQKGGLDAVINDEKSKEGNYIKKFHKQLPEGHPVKERIEEALPQSQPPVKKRAPFHGS